MTEADKNLAENRAQLSAEQTYNTFCEALDAMGWKYKKLEEDLIIQCIVSGKDMPMELVIYVRKAPKTFGIYSPLPFKIAESKAVDVAVAVSMVNNRLIHGCFDYDWTYGEIIFRIQEFYEGMVVSGEVCKYLVDCACQVVDRYNYIFLAINEGMMTIAQFAEQRNSKE
ncbi:MAG: hypothetical protein IJA90_00695 [Peptococcaceae bacterium]|nr:hypothetical protein [Peptococcaceae bacterium]